jgi:hypothetical protein
MPQPLFNFDNMPSGTPQRQRQQQQPQPQFSFAAAASSFGANPNPPACAPSLSGPPPPVFTPGIFAGSPARHYTCATPQRQQQQQQQQQQPQPQFSFATASRFGANPNSPASSVAGGRPPRTPGGLYSMQSRTPTPVHRRLLKVTGMNPTATNMDTSDRMIAPGTPPRAKRSHGDVSWDGSFPGSSSKKRAALSTPRSTPSRRGNNWPRNDGEYEKIWDEALLQHEVVCCRGNR